MRLEWWTFALESINFLVLMLILHRFLYKPVLAIIARRQQAITASLSDAAVVRRHADDALRGYEDKLAGFAVERDALLDEDREAIQAERRRILEQTRTEADDLARAVRDQLARERDDAVTDMREQAARLAVVMAETLLRDTEVRSITEVLFERACARLAGLATDELAHLVAPRGAEPALTVKSADALSADTEQRWRARLQDIVAPVCPDLAMSFVVDETLVAGVELAFSGAVVRLTWRDTLRRVEKELVADVHAA